MPGFPPSTITPPSLTDYEMWFNGVTFGGIVPGSAYQTQVIEGLDAAPIVSGDVKRPRDQGEFIGLDLLSGRTITATIVVQSDGTSLQHAMNALMTGLQPTGTAEVPLYYQLPNQALLASMVRFRRANWSIGTNYALNAGLPIPIQFFASDPRVYAAPTQAVTVALPTPPGGLTFPVTFPAYFGGGGIGGIIEVDNTGNIEMRPLITIQGPVTKPTITNSTTGWVITISNPNLTGYTLNDGDILTIDTDSHLIMYYPDGSPVGSSVRSWLVPGSTWPSPYYLPGIAPGMNQLEFTSADAALPSPAPTCTVEWAPAYISAN
jgi:hypothetical protein